MNDHPADLTLSRFADGELPPAALAEVTAHLADCPRCQAEVDQIRRLDEALRRLPVPPVPDELFASTDALLAEARLLRPKRAWWPVPLLALAVAATVAIVSVSALCRGRPDLRGCLGQGFRQAVPVALWRPAATAVARTGLGRRVGQPLGRTTTVRPPAATAAAPATGDVGDAGGTALAVEAGTAAPYPGPGEAPATVVAALPGVGPSTPASLGYPGPRVVATDRPVLGVAARAVILSAIGTEVADGTGDLVYLPLVAAP